MNEAMSNHGAINQEVENGAFLELNDLMQANDYEVIQLPQLNSNLLLEAAIS